MTIKDFFSFKKSAKKLIDLIQPDLVEARIPGLAGMGGLVSGRIQNVPTLAILVGFWSHAVRSNFSQRGILRNYVNLSTIIFYEFLISKLPDTAICLSDQLKDHYFKKYNSRVRAEVIPEVIPDERMYKVPKINSNSEEKRICFIGRLSPEKNLSTLLIALKRLDRIYQVRPWLDIVGDGPEQAKLMKLKEKLALNRVIFHGFQSHSNLTQFLKRANALVLPSLSEGFGAVLVEAMSAGRPCIASDVGGIPSLISNGHDGILFPPGDSLRLTEALQKILANLQLNVELGENARKTALKYHPKVSVAKKRRLLEFLVDKSKAD
ncbi:MAG: glycosyltransferase family 4 protein [Candidatus Heimdallarchaeota archaeon]